MEGRLPRRPGLTARAVLPVVLVAVLATVLTVPQEASAVSSCPTVSGGDPATPGDGTVSPPVSPGADLTDCDLSDANLRGADLTQATLTGADLTGADLTDATLTGIRSGRITPANPVSGLPTLPDPWVLSEGFLLGPGANLSYTNLRGVPLSGARLQNADLRGADLSGTSPAAETSLYTTVLNGADLRNAHLDYTLLQSTPAAGTDFSNATFRHARFLSANLSTAQLSGADFTGAIIGSGADGTSLNPDGLSGADFTDAVFTDVVVPPYTYSSTDPGELEISYYADRDATTVDVESLIPGFSVTAIGTTGLTHAESALSITFPESLLALGDYALQGSPANTLTFLGNVPTFVSGTTFQGMSDGTSLMILQYRPAYEADWLGTPGDAVVSQFTDPMLRKPIYQVTFSAAGSGVTGTPSTSAELQTLWSEPVTVSGRGTLARPGYTFAGWATSFDGTPVGSTYMPTEDMVLYSTWTRNASGGGGAPAPEASPSPSSAPTPTPTPIQEPVASPTPTPSVSTIRLPSAAMLQSTRPQPPGQTKALAKGVPAGTSMVLVNGRLEPSRLSVWERGMTVRSGPVLLAIRSQRSSGTGIAPSDGSLVVPDGGSRTRVKVTRSPRIALGGDGYAASTPIRVFLIPQPNPTASRAAHERIHDLGYVMTGADGLLRGSVTSRVRRGGLYILQINGTDERGAIRSVNLPAIVK